MCFFLINYQNNVITLWSEFIHRVEFSLSQAVLSWMSKSVMILSTPSNRDVVNNVHWLNKIINSFWDHNFAFTVTVLEWRFMLTDGNAGTSINFPANDKEKSTKFTICSQKRKKNQFHYLILRTPQVIWNLSNSFS